jgi:hypothetical protein
MFGALGVRGCRDVEVVQRLGRGARRSGVCILAHDVSGWLDALAATVFLPGFVVSPFLVLFLFRQLLLLLLFLVFVAALSPMLAPFQPL